MTPDDLLGEASDPMTPGERLRELAELYVLDPHPDSDEVEDSIAEAVCLGPSLPPDVLGQAMRHGVPHAWHNPPVPVLLLAEPLPEYREAARLTLCLVSPERHPDEPLEHLVLSSAPASSAAE